MPEVAGGSVLTTGELADADAEAVLAVAVAAGTESGPDPEDAAGTAGRGGDTPRMNVGSNDPSPLGFQGTEEKDLKMVLSQRSLITKRLTDLDLYTPEADAMRCSLL